MKFSLLFISFLAPLASWAKWSFVENQLHGYWQENSCYAFEMATTKVPTEMASIEVYNSRDNSFARPLIHVITQGMPDFYEATLYFDEDPTDTKFNLVKIQKPGDTLHQALTLKTDTKQKTADALIQLIQRDSVQVSLRSKKGEVKNLNFSLSKSSDSIRNVLEKCFTRLSSDVEGV